jgi:hypothetical protein
MRKRHASYGSAVLAFAQKPHSKSSDLDGIDPRRQLNWHYFDIDAF